MCFCSSDVRTSRGHIHQLFITRLQTGEISCSELVAYIDCETAVRQIQSIRQSIGRSPVQWRVFSTNKNSHYFRLTNYYRDSSVFALISEHASHLSDTSDTSAHISLPLPPRVYLCQIYRLIYFSPLARPVRRGFDPNSSSFPKVVVIFCHGQSS